VLVWLPVLACPLMHLFMHGSHGPIAATVNKTRDARAAGRS
jgi:hypothetical protein